MAAGRPSGGGRQRAGDAASLVYDALRGYIMGVSALLGVISTPETAAMLADYMQSSADFRAAAVLAMGLIAGLLLAYALR